MSKKHSLLKSFRYAFQGLGTAFKQEPNFRTQTIIALIILILAITLRFSLIEMVLLILVTGLVLILELVNTSLEALVDLITEEIKPEAKTAKDVCAGAVLLAAVLAVAIGSFLFLPKIFKL
jgi:diacylglycerol kinase (ATP)